MESSRRFKPPWTLVRENSECYVVKDANGVTLAWLYCRDDAQRYSFGVSKLSSDEARRIGKAIARIPEFMMQRQGFYSRGGGLRWRADRPYHVALEDRYIREHWDEIDARAAGKSAIAQAARELAEIQSTQFAVTTDAKAHEHASNPGHVDDPVAVERGLRE